MTRLSSIAGLLWLVAGGAAMAHPNTSCPEGFSRCRELTASEQERLTELLRTAELLLPLPADAPAIKGARPGSIDAQIAGRVIAHRVSANIHLSPFDKCLPYAAGCFLSSPLMSRVGLRRAAKDKGGATEYIDPMNGEEWADVLLRVDLDHKPVEYCPDRRSEYQSVREGPLVLVDRGKGPNGNWIALKFGPQACDPLTRPINQTPQPQLAPVRRLILIVQGRDLAEVEKLAAGVDRAKVLAVLARLGKSGAAPK